jgi:hypothetical protein
MGLIGLNYQKGITHAHHYTIHMHYPFQGIPINPLGSITFFGIWRGIAWPWQNLEGK